MIKPYRFHIGTTHERPDQLSLNATLKQLGSEWRVSVAKSVGLHIINPRTQMCYCPDDDGYVTIPDLVLDTVSIEIKAATPSEGQTR